MAQGNEDASVPPSAPATPLGIIASVLAHSHRIVLYLLVFGVLGGVYAAVSKPAYTTKVAFIPQTESSQSMLVSLAARMGMSVSGNNPEESAAFYARLLQSRPVLLPVVRMDYTDGDGRRWQTLSDYLKLKGRTQAQREAATVKWLQGNVLVGVDAQSGIVSYSVKAGSAAVSLRIAVSMLEGVQSFNETSRQFRAAAERRFVEDKLAERENELRNAEEGLERFLTDNREFRQAPQLMLQYERLQRDLARKNEIVTTLAQSFEQARIEEVRNTPRISIVEAPVLPAARDSKGVVLFSVLGLIFGALLAGLDVLGREVAARSRAESPLEYERFIAMTRDLLRVPTIRVPR
jgi:uncharacterized protein involved in exopolysaccharide biosynthesis